MTDRKKVNLMGPLVFDYHFLPIIIESASLGRLDWPIAPASHTGCVLPPQSPVNLADIKLTRLRRKG